MRIVVTGAGGMLGRDVVRAAADAGHDPRALSRAELDVLDAGATAAAIAAARPDVVVNCAAYTNVDGAETDEATATRVNGDGAGHVAEAAARVDAALVHVSTDYVFDGRKEDPYVESDPVGPASAYGRSKLAGEQAVTAAGPRHAIARSSWLFGTGGRNFVDTMLRLARERDEVRVVADQVGCPTYTAHLARALVSLAESDAYGVHHVAAEGACSWYDFAVEIFRLDDADCRVEACTTAEFPRPAPRPGFSVLATERDDGPAALPHWVEGLEAYLGERRGAA